MITELTVIITAGGIGKRFGSAIPKQFLEINGKPILIHTLERFYSFDTKAQLLLTLPADWKEYWEQLLQKYDCRIPHEIIEGGSERYHSVQNAVACANGYVIAVHDGVRPLVSFETIHRTIEAAKRNGAAVPVLPVKESLREIQTDGTSVAVERARFRLVQTPQCFHRAALLKAYKQPYNEHVTDDAGLVENAGYRVQLVEGNEENIKITSSLDLMLAQQLMSQ